jgi:hypothetical protein
MFIEFKQLSNILSSNGIDVTGILHIGAHECEELDMYNKMGVDIKDIIWIDALSQKVLEASKRGIPNVYNEVITDVDGKEVNFNISDNGQSSSIFPFGTHSIEHPWVKVIGTVKKKSVTIDTFFKCNNITPHNYNFWNFDIQGAELLALLGGKESIKGVDAIYLEVNEKELYKGCAMIHEIDDYLKTQGFSREWTSISGHGWGDALYIRK